MNTATMNIEPTAPPLRTDEDAVVRVGKTRVTLWVFLGSYHQGRSPQELAEEFPTLSLAEIHAAISYYLDHRSTLDAYMRQVDREWEAKKKEIESQPGYHEANACLLERAKARGLR